MFQVAGRRSGSYRKKPRHGGFSLFPKKKKDGKGAMSIMKWGGKSKSKSKRKSKRGSRKMGSRKMKAAGGAWWM
ncbi:hypothetical protein CVIRNUC_003317 [Coccomyxa viridis]|uniref:Sperm protamine P3 n=1 Tax=Coccomyxa viridis TaxID=1274662 RepID=A0AAV1I055_9CHLO|nr:hypothetical protein CVIRNUC_003317 [Coccomyxa viridis]